MGLTLITFVGIGQQREDGSGVGYDHSVYKLRKRESSATPYVQVAICELCPAESISRVIALCSKTAREHTWPGLHAALSAAGVVDVEIIEVGERLNPKEIWTWFDALFATVREEETLVLDVTHGLRAYAVVVSVAMDLLRQAKKAQIEHVFYGSVDAGDDGRALVDLSPFFTVNRWADAITGITERMDALGLERVAASVPRYQTTVIGKGPFREKLKRFAEAVRNVEANRIPLMAEELSEFIEQKRDTTGAIEMHLLSQLLSLLKALAAAPHDMSRPCDRYFETQARLSELLVSFGLYLEAFTILRELLGSLGAVPVADAGFSREADRKRRTWAAEAFIGCMTVKRENWTFDAEPNPSKRAVTDKVQSFYDRLLGWEYFDELDGLVEKIRQIRNGQNHAWLSKAKAPNDIPYQGRKLAEKTSELVRRLIEDGYIPRQGDA